MIELTLTMRPPPSAIMLRTTYLVMTMGASVFSRTSASICGFCIVARRPSVPSPALLTSPWIGPNSCLTLLTSAGMASMSPRSAGTKRIEPLRPSCASAIAAESAGPGFRATAMASKPAAARRFAMPSPMPRLAPGTIALRMGVARDLAGCRHVQGRRKPQHGRDLVGRQRLSAGREDLVAHGLLLRLPGVAGRRLVEHHRRDHDRARDRVLAALDERHPHARMTIDDRLHLLGVNLEAADVDDAASPPDEVAASSALLDHIAGVDETVGVGERGARRADIAGGRPFRADAQRSTHDLHLDLSAPPVEQIGREALEAVVDFEADARFGRGVGVADRGVGIGRPKPVQEALIGDLARQAHIRRGDR